MKKKTEKRITVAALAAAAAAGAIAPAALSNKLVTATYRISTRKLPSGKTIKIALVADLHSGNRWKAVADAVIALQPDLIALAGDIIDDRRGAKCAIQFFETLRDVAPIYYSIGNHECRTRQLWSVRAMSERHGAHVLSGRHETLDIGGLPVVIAGMDDMESTEFHGRYSRWAKEIKKTFAPLAQRPEFKILLSHRPETVAIYALLPFDLVLSGHAHGGQVRIPGLLNGLYASGQGMFPKYAGGLYRHGCCDHIVSRGVSYYPLLPRVFNPPELVSVEITGT